MAFSPISGTRPQPRRVPSQPIMLECGPFVGMRDSLDIAAADPKLASLLLNVYPQDGAVVVGRPGSTQLGAQLASGGRVQWLGQFAQVDGTEFTVAIVGGRLFTMNWLDMGSGFTWTEAVTAADLVTASITFDDEARVAALMFADQLIVSDGINTPFAWDGTTGSGGLTELTAAPVFYGPMTVYAGKLVGVMAADRSAIAWSAENDPEAGYGVAEQWTIPTQGEGSALTAVVGTNDALYVFRESSTTAILGTITEDFQTTHTRSAVHESIGTTSPFAVTLANGWIFFLDADARPHALQVGGSVAPIWNDFRETIRPLPAVQSNASAVYDHALKLVRVQMVETAAADEATLTLVFDPTQSPPRAVGVFRGHSATTMGTGWSGSAPYLLHGTEDGYIAYHGRTFDELGSDTLRSVSADIAYAVKSPFMAGDVAGDLYFHRIDAALRAGTTMTSVGVDYETPYGASQTQSVTVESSLARYEEATYEVDTYASDAVDVPLRVGINGTGRWIRVRFQHQQMGERFGVSTLRVWGQTRSTSPTNP